MDDPPADELERVEEAAVERGKDLKKVVYRGTGEVPHSVAPEKGEPKMNAEVFTVGARPSPPKDGQPLVDKAHVTPPLSRSKDGEKVPDDDEEKPFDTPGFLEGLRKAGFLEMFDVSRGKIKERYSHALEKSRFQISFMRFLEQKKVKPRGDFMIRFLGGEEHAPWSPFVHVYTNAPLKDVETLRVYADDPEQGYSVWTHLMNRPEGTEHWSCQTKLGKGKGFWPLRVVLDHGVGETKEAKELTKKLPSNTRANAQPAAKVPERRKTLPALSTSLPSGSAAKDAKSPSDPTSASTPTLAESLKQVGRSLHQALPPTVQSGLNSGLESIKAAWYGSGEKLPDDAADGKEVDKSARRKERAKASDGRESDEERQRRRERKRRERALREERPGRTPSRSRRYA